jgi:hypothetical protein
MYKGFFWEKRAKVHNLRKKHQKSLHLNNEFLEVARTNQDPKTFQLCWLTSSQNLAQSSCGQWPVHLLDKFENKKPLVLRKENKEKEQKATEID